MEPAAAVATALFTVATSLKSRLFFASTVPLPTMEPSAGTTASRLSARSPVVAMCKLVVNFSMIKSPPDLIPASAPMPDNFCPRSKPASFPLNKPIVPSVTSLSVGPETWRLVFIVPALSRDLSGRLMPRAGRKDSRSVAGRPSPVIFRSTAKLSPSDLYVPLRLDLAFPIFSVEGCSTPVPFTRSYLVSKLTTAGTPAGLPPATSTAFESFNWPFVAIWPFSLTKFASMSATPPSPSEGSRKPVLARLSPLIVSFTFCGVSAASSASTGPILPSIFMVPPPGNSIENRTGKLFFIATLVAVRFTFE